MPNNENANKETVSFRCNSDFMVGHFSALPLHCSQKIEDKVVSLRVIINTELENKLLSYGEQVEVLAPEGLRGRMRERLKMAEKQY
jgi:predicted DNA-binding transcriptional regulator YafY